MSRETLNTADASTWRIGGLAPLPPAIFFLRTNDRMTGMSRSTTFPEPRSIQILR